MHSRLKRIIFSCSVYIERAGHLQKLNDRMPQEWREILITRRACNHGDGKFRFSLEHLFYYIP